jgi:hypothetical protein
MVIKSRLSSVHLASVVNCTTIVSSACKNRKIVKYFDLPKHNVYSEFRNVDSQGINKRKVASFLNGMPEKNQGNNKKKLYQECGHQRGI